MKRLLLLLTLALVSVHAITRAQQNPQQGHGAPSGVCVVPYTDVDTGNLYTCKIGQYVLSGGNPDPPVTQNYSLTATGAQTAINLTAAPIDTHTISWRPSGTVSTCTVALDTSPDGVTWTSGGAIAGQTCTSAGQASSPQATIANFVRVNLTTLTGGGTLTVVYSGRLATSPPNGSPVSNGIYVTTSDIIWAQWTGIPNAVTLFTTFRIQKPDGTIYDATKQGTAWSVSSGCANASGGVGTGLAFPVSGWLISATTYISAGTISNGQAYANLYILQTMPAGGGTSSCVGTLGTSTIGTLLMGSNTSAFFPVTWTVGGGNLVQSSVSGPGYPQNQNPANPAAGANLAVTALNTNGVAQKIQLVSIHFRLVTSASVASRIVCITIGTSGGTVLTTACGAGTQAASQTVDYDFMVGAGSSCPTALITGTNCITPLPNNYFVQGNVDDSVATVITGIQAADQISNIWFKKLLWQEQD